jgi:hypothetical protein
MMKKINLFDKFSVNEAFGIAKPTTFYIRKLTWIAIDEFYKYVDATRELGKDAIDDIEYDVIIGYNQLIDCIPKGGDSLEQYSKFPVSEIVLDMNMHKHTTEKMKGNDWMIGGYAMPFAKGRESKATRFKDAVKQLTDHSVSIHLGLEMFYGPYFKRVNTNHPYFERSHLFKKIESVISHELNHLYEFYNRKINKASSIRLAPTMASLVENTYKVPDNIFDVWSNEFLVYIYQSESHEINAQTQEAETYISRMGWNRFKTIRLYKDAIKMKNWNYKSFLEDLKKEIHDENMDIDLTVDRLKEYFLIDYQNQVIELKETPIPDPWKLSNMSTEKFFMYYEKIIKEAGEKLFRNFAKLHNATNN